MLLSGKFCVQNELVRKLSWTEAMPLDMDLLESTRKGSAALIYYSYGLLRGNQRSVKPLLVHLLLQMEDSAAISSAPCQILGLLFLKKEHFLCFKNSIRYVYSKSRFVTLEIFFLFSLFLSSHSPIDIKSP